jgi:hypothetical protein
MPFVCPASWPYSLSVDGYCISAIPKHFHNSLTYIIFAASTGHAFLEVTKKRRLKVGGGGGDRPGPPLPTPMVAVND